MYKNFTNYLGIAPRYAVKIPFMIKVTIFALLTTILQVKATVTMAQRVTLDEKNARLSEIIKKIRVQSGFDFIYNEELVNNIKGINLHVKNNSVEETLNLVLANQPITFTIENKLVVIKRKPSPVIPSNSSDVFAGWVTIKVVSSAGKLLSGATVINKRNRASGKTDEQGQFRINVMVGDVIEVSYLGYQSVSTTIDETMLSTGNITVDLKPVITDLKEVVVNTGYQKIKPEQSTGAVSQLTTKEFESQISTDFLSGINGKLSGVMINNDIKFNSTVNGVSSSKSLFNIRGISTITGNQNPLIVIDGFPTELSLNMIDPNEILSVTILKDAAAATVYGVRASNGVIVIERKKAALGAPKMNFRATLSLTPREDYTRYRWAKNASAISIDYDREVNKSAINENSWNNLTNYWAGQYNPAYYIMAQEKASLMNTDQANAAFDALKGYNNSEDYSRLLQRNASVQNYHFDISGGSSNATYYFTTNYIRNNSSAINNNNNNILLSGRSNFQINPRLSAEFMTDYQESKNNAAPVPDINSLYSYERLQDANGNPMSVLAGSSINPYYNNVLMNKGLEDYLYYPLVDVNEINDKTRATSNRTTLNLNYKLIPGVTATLGGIYESVSTKLRHYATEKSSEARQYIDSYTTLDNTGNPAFNIPKGGFLKEQNSKSSSYTFRAQLNYDKTIGSDHAINGIIGGELRNVTQQGSSAAYFGYNDETLLQQGVDFNGISNYNIIGSYISRRSITYTDLFNQTYNEDRFISAYSNIAYTYKHRYSLTGSIRIDQSNLFGTDPKYRYKPLWSLGAAWNITNEDFLKDNSWVHQLKLRAAYGFNGNVAKLSLPQVIAKNYINVYTYPYSQALQMSSYANGSLRWEQTKNMNIGLDYGIIGNVNGSIDFYRKNSTDLLASAQIDPTIGISPSFINNASIQNNGMEITLRADWIRRPDVNWNTGFVLSHNTSKVLKIYQDLYKFPTVTNTAGYVEGQPVGALYAYKWGGIDANGKPTITDNQGNKISNLDYDNTSAALYYKGSSIPTVNIGLSNRLDIGNFYFYCMVSYYGGFKVQVPRLSPSGTHPLEGSDNYWRTAGDEQGTDIMALSSFSNFYERMVYDNADSYVVNGSYITIRDITASYTFDKSTFLKNIGLNHFEVKLQASNVWTKGFNKYNYSVATGNYAKPYLTPVYSIAVFTNF